MSPRYASTTHVSKSTSQAEIERTLRRYGATAFLFATDEDRAVIGFVMRGRNIRFILPMPSPRERRFTHTPTGQARTFINASKEHGQAERTMWRQLLLIIKAKLEAVESGALEFEEEFLPYTVLPDNRTVADHVRPRMTEALESAGVPELLPG